MTRSKARNVQYVAALMKAHGISELVISPGARNIPLVHTVETDPFFTCHSVVDERSAAYYAIGLAQRTGRPVAISCTSSVAASNYLPGLTEAFHLQVPILVLTADRNPYYVGQMENQQIDQVNMYGSVCRRCVNLPVVNTDEDAWYCQRLVNEAILELDHHGRGPVQINFPVAKGLGEFEEEGLPPARVIRRHEAGRYDEGWRDCANKLAQAKKVLVICGSKEPDPLLDQLLDSFHERFGCVISKEHISNVQAASADDLFHATQVIPPRVFAHYVPDIVISYGMNYVSRLKDLLRGQGGKFEHWGLNPAGEICDTLLSQTEVFESTPSEFFAYMAATAPADAPSYVTTAAAAGAAAEVPAGTPDREYENSWLHYASIVPNEPLSWGNGLAIQKLAEKVPAGTLVHTGILNATRIMESCPLPKDVTSYCNVGAYGIDGSMSTFMGQAAATDSLCFLVLGDLSFFYDMNALQIRGIGKNVRILLLNNSGAAEFHFFLGREKLPTINDYTAAEHSRSAKGWAESCGFTYLRAEDEASLAAGIDQLVGDSDTPVILEVISDKEQDAKVLKASYSSAARAADAQRLKENPSQEGAAAAKAVTRKATSKLKSLFGRG